MKINVKLYLALKKHMPDANLTLTALTTSVIPFLRVCESGLMDVGKGELVDLIV